QPAALVLAAGWLATRPESSFADLLARLEAHRTAVPRALPEPAASEEDAARGPAPALQPRPAPRRRP
ncbi:hypothetical protein, partial [Streptomyces sp. NEAU-H3]|uniref:hypothetical protein n=1 Tax=Streptomyces sp. NEAU-H3 TaxID=2720636 RepID=UPI001FD763E6